MNEIGAKEGSAMICVPLSSKIDELLLLETTIVLCPLNVLIQ